MSSLAYRYLGFLEFSRHYLRLTWLEISWSLGFALTLCNFRDDDDLGHFSLHIHLLWPNIFLKLPFLPRRAPRDQMMDKWGFSVDSDSWAAIHFDWGSDGRIVGMPWELRHYRTSHLMADGSWLHEMSRRGPSGRDNWKAVQERKKTDGFREDHPYFYTLRSGEVQHRTATITVDEREWRRRWLMWCPLFRKVRKSIEVDFSDEVGERSGSWKGGTVGCGYEMKRGETPEQTLRRMERDRTFR